MSEKNDLMARIEEEIDGRIKTMSDPGYEHIAPMNQQDYILAAIIAVICVAGIILGLY